LDVCDLFYLQRPIVSGRYDYLTQPPAGKTLLGYFVYSFAMSTVLASMMNHGRNAGDNRRRMSFGISGIALCNQSGTFSVSR
jgi:hypothetical protein